MESGGGTRIRRESGRGSGMGWTGGWTKLQTVTVVTSAKVNTTTPLAGTVGVERKWRSGFMGSGFRDPS